MLLNTMETVAENEESGLKCLSMTVQRDDKVEYLHFGETPGKNSDSVLLAKERFNISSKDSVLLAKERFNISSKYIYIYTNRDLFVYIIYVHAFHSIPQTRGTRSYAS